MWARQLLEGFDVMGQPARLDRKPNPDYPVANHAVLLQDNKSTIHLITTGRGSFRNSKHIRVREHFIRDLVRDGEIIVKWQHTTLMVADILSKGVSKKVFYSLLEALIGKRLIPKA